MDIAGTRPLYRVTVLRTNASHSSRCSIVGCAHRGLINTVRCAIELTGDSRVRAVIGGTHLAPAARTQVESTIKELRALDVGRLVACHCTGFGPAAELRLVFGESFSPGGVGASFAV